MDPSKEMADLLHFLRTHQMKETELSLRRECRSLDNQISSTRPSINVHDYFTVYSCLSNFILHSFYRIELMQFLFPIFVHFYLNLLEYDYVEECQEFYYRFARATPLESLHDEFFYQLRLVSRASKHLDRSPLIDSFRTSRFFLRLSMTSCTEMQHFMDSMKNQIRLHSRSDLTAAQIALLQSIFQRNLKVDINKQSFTSSNTVRYQTNEQTMTPLFVHSNVANAIQFTRLYTAVFPLQPLTTDAARTSGVFSQPLRRETSSYYPQINYNRLPNSFDLNTVPRLGPHQLPSICLFTLKSSKQLINCVTLSHDCRLLAIGCDSSDILVCSVNPTKELYSMKPAKHLRHLLANAAMNGSSDHILDTASSIEPSNERVLIGHTAAVFALNFDPNQQAYLLSGSQDCTLRLWHLVTWSCLLVYRMHYLPVLDGNFDGTRILLGSLRIILVTFASVGSLFASCGMDGLLCLWTVEKASPIRIYPEHGHLGPVYLAEFHPNSNYLASAHHDHTIHLWNIHHDNALVRIFNGHRHQLSALRFSPNGHFLGSGCWHGEFILWDIQNNLQIAHLSLHQEAISTIEFSPLTGTLLLIGSIDCSISLWNCFMITKIYDEKLAETSTVPSSTNRILLNVFKTKATSILHMRFSKENILYAIGLMEK